MEWHIFSARHYSALSEPGGLVLGSSQEVFYDNVTLRRLAMRNVDNQHIQQRPGNAVLPVAESEVNSSNTT